MPDYLLVDSDNREMDKFDAKLMHTQIVSLLKAVKLVDGTETTKLGKSDGYSFSTVVLNDSGSSRFVMTKMTLA